MRTLVAVAAFAVLTAAASFDPVGFGNSFDVHRWWGLQGVLLLLIICLFACYLYRYYQADIKPRIPRTIDDIPRVPDDEAYELQRLAGKIRLNAKQARIFTLAILEPAELRERVAEQYIPSQRTVNQEVTIEAKVPNRFLELKTDDKGLGSKTLFPVLVIPKGALNDNLQVYDADGKRVPLLSYREYLQLTAGILRLLLCQAYGAPVNGQWRDIARDSTGSAASSVRHLEHRALCEIIKRASANVAVKETLGTSPISSDAEDIARLLVELQDDKTNTVYLRFAADLVRKLSLHYALVASTVPDVEGRLVITYRRTLIPELELAPDQAQDNAIGLASVFRRLKGWLRILFSARPVNVTVSLDNAWTCRSYHVRVDAPEGLYLARQRFIASQEYLESKAKGAPTPLHYRFRRRLGQPYAHFYGRFFPVPLSKQRRPKVQLDFFEIPPGSDFRAAIASAACLGLVWLVGFVMSRTQDPGTDAPAFLLAFPGVAASWLGFDTPAHRLFEGTLAARLSLALTTLVSVTASGLFVLNRTGLSLLYGTMPTDIPVVRASSSVLGIDKWAWAVLTFISLYNTLYMASRWMRHAWRFKHLAERPDPDRM